MHRARAALSRLMEPSDGVGLALVAAVGPVDALAIAGGAVKPDPGVHRVLAQALAESGVSGRDATLGLALQRWAPRVSDLEPERDLATITRFGGRLLAPEDELWPAALADLGPAEPLCLWVRGNLETGIPAMPSTAAVVGSRDSTNYGAGVAGELAAGLVGRGMTVISGGAYGIDAQAHRAALAGADEEHIPTVAVMASGLDRYYPSGNEDLLRTISQRGLLIGEVPPGAAPTRWRFLQRNRIIAALSAVTVVVEARWRSGALNTAHHAAGLGRAVGAVPGSVYSANSAGCHRLLRDGSAVCVTDAAEVAELAGPFDAAAAPGGGAGEPADHDGLTTEDLLLLDALPVRSGSTTDKLASVAGLSPGSVRAGLARLEMDGLAERSDAGWRRIRRL